MSLQFMVGVKFRQFVVQINWCLHIVVQGEVYQTHFISSTYVIISHFDLSNVVGDPQEGHAKNKKVEETNSITNKSPFCSGEIRHSYK